jgi:hypothetical protein
VIRSPKKDVRSILAATHFVRVNTETVYSARREADPVMASTGKMDFHPSGVRELQDAVELVGGANQ